MQSDGFLKNGHFNLKKSILACVFLIELVFLITPTYLTMFPAAAVLFIYTRCLWVVAEVVWLINRKFSLWKYLPILLMMVYCILLLFSSLLNRSTAMNNCISKAVSLILIVIVMSRKSNENFQFYGNIIRFYGVVIITLNLVSYFLFPNGLYRLALHGGGGTLAGNAGYFLGVDNGFGAFIFPFLLFSGYYSFLKKQKADISFILLIAVSAVTYITTHSVTGLMSLAAFIGLFCLLLLPKTSKLINYKYLLAAFIVMTWFIVILGGFSRMNNAISDFIINDLGKDMTFSGRTGIWERAIELIKQKWVLGYGTVKDGAYISGFGNARTKFGAHNTILQISLESGLISLILVFATLLLIIKYVDKKSKNEKARSMFHIGLFSTWVYYTFESANIVPLFGVLCLIYTAFWKETKVDSILARIRQAVK